MSCTMKNIIDIIFGTNDIHTPLVIIVLKQGLYVTTSFFFFGIFNAVVKSIKISNY